MLSLCCHWMRIMGGFFSHRSIESYLWYIRLLCIFQPIQTCPMHQQKHQQLKLQPQKCQPAKKEHQQKRKFNAIDTYTSNWIFDFNCYRVFSESIHLERQSAPANHRKIQHSPCSISMWKHWPNQFVSCSLMVDKSTKMYVSHATNGPHWNQVRIYFG